MMSQIGTSNGVTIDTSKVPEEQVPPNGWVIFTNKSYSVDGNMRNDEYSIITTVYDINGTVGEISYSRFVINGNASEIRIYNNNTDKTYNLDNQVVNLVNHTLTVEVETKYLELIDEIEIVFNGGSYLLNASPINNVSMVLEEGINRFHVHARSELGHDSETYTYYTWLDTSPPTPDICIDLDECDDEISNLISGFS